MQSEDPPMAELSLADRAKFAAARAAVDLVQDGMRLGLGTGSTAAWMVRALAERARREDMSLTCVATSVRTAELARNLGLRVVDLDTARWLDLTIDGADEFDPDLALIKGGGGALLMEKIVATASDAMVVITDAAKEVQHLGSFPLPVEVIPFGWRATQALIGELLETLDVMGTETRLRIDGDHPYVTDEGNYILDLDLKRIGNPRQVSLVLNQVPGVVENGLFIDICDKVLIGTPDGRVESRDITDGTVTEMRIDFAASDNIFRNL